MRFNASILVSQPMETVFTWLTQPEHVVQWIQPRVVQKTFTGDPSSTTTIYAGKLQDLSALPLHVGATFHYVIESLKPFPSYAVKITKYEPPRTFSFETRLGATAPSQHWITLQSVEQETRMSYTLTTNPGCFLAWTAPLWTPLSKKMLLEHMRMLKKQLEVQTS